MTLSNQIPCGPVCSLGHPVVIVSTSLLCGGGLSNLTYPLEILILETGTSRMVAAIPEIFWFVDVHFVSNLGIIGCSSPTPRLLFPLLGCALPFTCVLIHFSTEDEDYSSFKISCLTKDWDHSPNML